MFSSLCPSSFSFHSLLLDPRSDPADLSIKTPSPLSLVPSAISPPPRTTRSLSRRQRVALIMRQSLGEAKHTLLPCLSGFGSIFPSARLCPSLTIRWSRFRLHCVVWRIWAGDGRHRRASGLRHCKQARLRISKLRFNSLDNYTVTCYGRKNDKY